MALLVSGLTITLAVANTALLKALRKGMEWFEYVAGVFVLLTGMYLTYYWYHDLDSGSGSSDVIDKAQSWQGTLRDFVRDNQAAIVWLASLVTVAAIGFAVWNKRRRDHQPAA